MTALKSGVETSLRSALTQIAEIIQPLSEELATEVTIVEHTDNECTDTYRARIIRFNTDTPERCILLDVDNGDWFTAEAISGDIFVVHNQDRFLGPATTVVEALALGVVTINNILETIRSLISQVWDGLTSQVKRVGEVYLSLKELQLNKVS